MQSTDKKIIQTIQEIITPPLTESQKREERFNQRMLKKDDRKRKERTGPVYLIATFDAVNAELLEAHPNMGLRKMIDDGHIYSAIGKDGIERVIKNQVTSHLFLESEKIRDEVDEEDVGLQEDIACCDFLIEAKKKTLFIETAINTFIKAIPNYSTLSEFELAALKKNTDFISEATRLYELSTIETEPKKRKAPAIKAVPIDPAFTYLQAHCNRDSSIEEVIRMYSPHTKRGPILDPTIAEYIRYYEESSGGWEEGDPEPLYLFNPKYG